MKFRPSKYDRPAFGKMASQYGLVYYGTAIAGRDADYTPVRGITASPDQIDENYTTGYAGGHRVHLLQRSHNLYGAGGDTRRTWTICQVDMNQALMPHIYLHNRNNDQGHGVSLISYLPMYELDSASLSCPLVDSFVKQFAIYVLPEDIARLEKVLTVDVQNMLAAYFTDIDVEFNFKKVYLYSLAYPTHLITLDKMLRIGVWLANKIDFTGWRTPTE